MAAKDGGVSREKDAQIDEGNKWTALRKNGGGKTLSDEKEEDKNSEERNLRRSGSYEEGEKRDERKTCYWIGGVDGGIDIGPGR